MSRPTLADMMPDRLPPTWRPICDPRGLTGTRWFSVRDLRVCVTLDVCEPGGTWLHTSVSVKGGRRLPTWSELSLVKGVIHEDRLVVQILPPRSQYVNVAEVLHLWERIDAPTLPDDVSRFV